MKKTALHIESTPETKEQQNKNLKLPYEKPELSELGNVGDMTTGEVSTTGYTNFG